MQLSSSSPQSGWGTKDASTDLISIHATDPWHLSLLPKDLLKSRGSHHKSASERAWLTRVLLQHSSVNCPPPEDTHQNADQEMAFRKSCDPGLFSSNISHEREEFPSQRIAVYTFFGNRITISKHNLYFCLAHLFAKRI